MAGGQPWGIKTVQDLAGAEVIGRTTDLPWDGVNPTASIIAILKALALIAIQKG